MDQTKVAKLEADGWTIGTPKEFLNLAEDLAEDEGESIEMEVPVSRIDQPTHH